MAILNLSNDNLSLSYRYWDTEMIYKGKDDVRNGAGWLRRLVDVCRWPSADEGLFLRARNQKTCGERDFVWTKDPVKLRGVQVPA